jgi:predicted neuraminidase
VRKTVLALIISSISAFISGQNLFRGEQCIVKMEFIYRSGDVPFPSCHASTIIEIDNGLVAAWFGGTSEKSPDVGIWISEFKEGKWTTPIEAANGIKSKSKRYPCWNPVLFNTGKKILLFYKVGPSPSSWWGEYKESVDSGKTWSAAIRLPDNIYGPIKNKPILLDNGVLLCPSSSENHGWRVHIESTFDFGQTWERTKALNKRDTPAIQPTLLVLNGGRIEFLCRSDIGYILRAESEDYGNTWSRLLATELPNPNSGIDAVSLKDGRKLLVYNHLIKGRNRLNVAVSEDGIRWEAAAMPENDEEGKEFSYPAVIQTNDGLVHITYTWNRKLIRHIVIDPVRIVTHPFTAGKWPE